MGNLQKKYLKPLLIAWVFNFFYTTAAVWSYHYTASIENWTSGPLEFMAWSGGLIKVVMTIYIVILLVSSYQNEDSRYL